MEVPYTRKPATGNGKSRTSLKETGLCEISGTVSYIDTPIWDECGGTIEYVWEYTDNCFNTISHTQNVTVDPAPSPSFHPIFYYAKSVLLFVVQTNSVIRLFGTCCPKQKELFDEIQHSQIA